MDYFAETYDYTTNPETSHIDALKKALPSIIIHSILYTMIAKFLMKIKLLPKMADSDVFLSMLAIMSIGYYLRLSRAKSLSKIYDNQSVKNMMDNAYMCWYFLG